jgi:hypothetical protein
LLMGLFMGMHLALVVICPPSVRAGTGGDEPRLNDSDGQAFGISFKPVCRKLMQVDY